MTKSILLVGVGGQGTILASKLLTIGLGQEGYDVKMSEIHGMSQRGGSVTTQIRYGDKVNAPVIGPGEADLIVSFEEEETYRWMKYLKPDGKVVLNKFRIPSSPILTGEETYPEGLIDEIKAKVETTVIPASAEAEKLGSPQSMNIVLLGALVKAMGLTDIDWEKIMAENTKAAFLEKNMQAFRVGLEYLS
ncbi:MAG: indolepyruvate oxidoreductase subunit beta [Eubacteriaceae bacterium]|nr:indolepyruvate oxidoreductase subunit beta [Eubacteriaceae bacterium]